MCRTFVVGRLVGWLNLQSHWSHLRVFSAWTVSMCLWRKFLRLNAISHLSHLNVFIASWIIICFLKFFRLWNGPLHTSQVGLSPECKNMWILRPVALGNLQGHIPQIKGLSFCWQPSCLLSMVVVFVPLLWVIRCSCKTVISLKLLKQIEHTSTLLSTFGMAGLFLSWK